MNRRFIDNSREIGIAGPAMPARSGIAVFWMLALLPVTLVAMQLVLEVGWLHRTRSELQIAVDSAALAGARVWGTGSPDPGSDTAGIRSAAKSTATDILAAHSISGTNVLSTVSSNDAPGQTNNNASCPGTMLLGDFLAGAFTAGSVPPTADRRACRVEVVVTIASPFGLGDRTLSATSTAVWSSGSNRAELVTVSSNSCL